MANYVTDDAICLRVLDFSETSQIVGLLTRRHGLVPMIAKGSKRQSKKNTMSGPLDLLTSGEVVFVPAKGAAELATLAGWELIDHRNGLRKELAGLNGGMVAAEVTTMLVHPHDPHEGLFEELEATLELMGGPLRLRGLVAYVKAALAAAGYGVRFDVCGGCGKTVTGGGAEGKVRFSTRGGGVFCAECGVEGTTTELPGKIAVALDRLVVPTVLKGEGGEKAGDAAALLTAMELLLGHVESITGKGMRTRGLLTGIFGQKRVN